LYVVYEVEKRKSVSASSASDNDECFMRIHDGKIYEVSIIEMFYNSTQIMSLLSLSTSYVDGFLSAENVELGTSLLEAHQSLQKKSCVGADFLGWIDLPVTLQNSLDDIEATAQKIRGTSDVLMVC